MEIIFNDLINKIKSKNNIQPILFTCNDKNKLNLEVEGLINKIFTYFWVPKNYIHILDNDNEIIKISQIREFIEKWTLKSNYDFQIFLIKNISRFNLKSANASLKFFEEPWKWNIIFLTNKNESQILDTIISRVKVVNILWNDLNLNEEKYFKLIDDFLNKKNIDLISYFFNDKKIEKNEYIIFLNTFINYVKNNNTYYILLEPLLEALSNIEQNNAISKYELDKILILKEQILN